MGEKFLFFIKLINEKIGGNVYFKEQKEGNQMYGKWEVGVFRVEGSFNKFGSIMDLGTSVQDVLRFFEK